MPPKKENKFQRTQGRGRKESEDVNLIEIWKPTTRMGKKVKDGLLTDIDEIFHHGERILEPEIVDVLLPDLETDLLLIGQAKGKFGGGQRRIFRQTQKKTSEGNKIHFATCALAGNQNGYLGVNFGKSKETVPARDKSLRKAKLNLIKIRRGCGSWECNCGEPHSIPFTIEGKCGSSIIKLMPAPKGKGLCVEKECAKILRLAGIKDVWSKTQGQTKSKSNLIKALIKSLNNLSEMKIQPNHPAQLGISEGRVSPKKDTEELAPPKEEDFADVIKPVRKKETMKEEEENDKNK